MEVAFCPYCGERHEIGAARVGELVAYREGVDRHLAAADEELKHVAGWAATEESISWSSVWPLLLVFMGLPMLFGVGMTVASAQGWLDDMDMGRLSVGFTVVVNLLAVGAVVVSFVRRARTRGDKARLGGSRVACPGCGAVNHIAAGQELTTCSHCGGALVPGQTLIAQNLDAARQARRRAEIERLAAERRGTVKLMSYSRSSRLVPLVSLGPMMLGLVVATVVGTKQMLQGTLQPRDAPAVYLGWGLTTVLIGAVVVWVMLRRTRQATYDAAVEDLKPQLGPAAQSFDDIAHLAAWLDTYWPTDYKTVHLNGGTYFHGIAGHVHGYPVLIDLNPTPTDKYRRQRLHLFVATTEGPAVDDASRHRANLLERAMEAEGFDVRSSEAGLLAIASKKVIRDVHRTPGSLHAVLPELARLTQIAAARGLSPAPPIA